MILDVDKYAKKYIEYIKAYGCTACYDRTVDADHLNTVGMGNDRKKPRREDFSCIPLCRKCHTERGQIGDTLFEKKHKVNLWKDLNHYLMDFLTE